MPLLSLSKLISREHFLGGHSLCGCPLLAYSRRLRQGLLAMAQLLRSASSGKKTAMKSVKQQIHSSPESVISQ